MIDELEPELDAEGIQFVYGNTDVTVVNARKAIVGVKDRYVLFLD